MSGLSRCHSPFLCSNPGLKFPSAPLRVVLLASAHVALISLGLGLLAGVAIGQEVSRTVEVYAGSQLKVQSDYLAIPQGRPSASPPPHGLVSGPAVSKATLSRSDELASAAGDAFRRGLMPTRDYLERLSFVHSLHWSGVSENSTSRSMKALARNHVEELERAFQAISRLRQPASEGWAAETALVNIAIAEAHMQLAAVTGDQQHAFAAREQFRQSATDYLEFVQFDSQLGIASLPTMSHAILIAADANLSNPTDRLSFVSEVQDEIFLATNAWWNAGAEIGRIDERDSSAIEAIRPRLTWMLLDESIPQASDFLQTADAAAERVFRSRWEFFQKGTESLSGLTDAWVTRHRLQELARETDSNLVSEELHRGLKEDLEVLREASVRTTDRRGRNLADVQFVELIIETVPENTPSS
ncbi:MAG: hypothetical protein KDA80_09985 [Planctomycetaceae bacterium]|nr:hypothetical protein [Planctomycetaceae bacterium]